MKYLKKVNVKINKKTLLVIIPLFILLGLAGTTVYFYLQYQKVKRNPNIIAQQEIKSVVSVIGKYMDLPSDEEPTLATVTDKEKLKDQPFFKNAQNGDKVLIYPKAAKAILFRPSTGRVIEFAPLILGAEENQGLGQQQSQNQNQNLAVVSVAIYNGTKIAGLASEYEKKLAGVESIKVVSKANAAKSDYDKTIIIDLSGRNKDAVGRILQAVGGEVVDKLPEGENNPQADILVIAGQK